MSLKDNFQKRDKQENDYNRDNFIFHFFLKILFKKNLKATAKVNIPYFKLRLKLMEEESELYRTGIGISPI